MCIRNNREPEAMVREGAMGQCSVKLNWVWPYHLDTARMGLCVHSKQFPSHMLSKRKDEGCARVLCINMHMCLHAYADLERGVLARMGTGNISVEHQCKACELCRVFRKDRLVRRPRKAHRYRAGLLTVRAQCHSATDWECELVNQSDDVASCGCNTPCTSQSGGDPVLVCGGDTCKQHGPGDFTFLG